MIIALLVGIAAIGLCSAVDYMIGFIPPIDRWFEEKSMDMFPSEEEK